MECSNLADDLKGIENRREGRTMKYNQFVAGVQDRPLLDSPEEAVRAIGASLETLGERLPPDEAHSLAEQLPPELGRYLEQAAGGQNFDLDEFYTRVSERQGVDISEGTACAQVVMEVLAEPVSPGVLGMVLHRPSGEYNSLFGGASKGGCPADGDERAMARVREHAQRILEVRHVQGVGAR